MAKVRQRTWTIPGQRTKRKAWGYVAVDSAGKQVRQFKAEWTKEDAEAALAAHLLNIEQPKASSAGITLGEAVERYKGTRTNRGNPRSAGERRQLEHLKGAFGADTPLSAIIAGRISEYKAARFGLVSAHTKSALKAASVNRPLSILRHLLQVAHEEWEVLPTVPRIKPEKEPQGRIRWLEADEEVRLLSACEKSLNKFLFGMVALTLETGLRKGELLGLTWDRVDLSRGVLRLEVTKSGKRREVPIGQRGYAVLAGLPAPHEGRVWPDENFRTAFQNATKAAKLNSPFKFHDCRHHFASWYVMNGGSLQVLQKLLGHASLTMTMKYAHLSPEYLRADVAKVEASRARRRAEGAAEITQGITHEGQGQAVEVESGSLLG